MVIDHAAAEPARLPAPMVAEIREAIKRMEDAITEQTGVLRELLEPWKPQ
jgi:hypothetical protein